jgi:hypothetical protein
MTQVIDINPKIWQDMFADSAIALEKRGLYKLNLLYRSFSPDRLEHVLQKGTDRDNSSSTWGWIEDAERLLFLDSEEMLEGGYWKGHGTKDNVWTVAVYDPDTVKHIGSDKYRLPKGLTPIAILRINMADMRPGYKVPDESLRLQRKRDFKNRYQVTV